MTPGDEVMESVFPPECKGVADELDSMNVFLRDSYFGQVIPIKFWINGLSNMQNEFFDIIDIPKRLFMHDIYSLGYDIADLLITVVDGISSPGSAEGETEPDDWDDFIDDDYVPPKKPDPTPTPQPDPTPVKPDDDNTTAQSDTNTTQVVDIEQYRSKLTPEQWKVAFEQGTEPPFKNAYWNNHKPGIYKSVASGAVLFSSKDKFDSGTGWPSFWASVNPDLLTEKVDHTLGMTRTEVSCSVDHVHLGHVFNDGPVTHGGKRYCMNSASLTFVPVDQMTE